VHVMTQGNQATTPWRVTVEDGARRLAAITLAGALLGVLVGGIGGRLAMMLLAALNPQATGLVSDDGFTIGQFTLLGSLQLLGASAQIGVIGAAVYFAVRGLMLGPRWFQVLAISVGPAVVIGALLVHTDDTVDFTQLSPVWLAIALFVLVPGVYAGLLTVVAERWLAADRWFATARLPLPLLPLLLFVIVAPMAVVIALMWLTWEWLKRRQSLRRTLGSPLLPWLARAGLTVVFVIALVDLVGDTWTLT
jgi:hypothetical protein